jgi:hypothetical protein
LKGLPHCSVQVGSAFEGKQIWLDATAPNEIRSRDLRSTHARDWLFCKRNDMSTVKGLSSPADSPEENVLVIEVAPAAQRYGDTQTERVASALAAGRTVVLQPIRPSRDSPDKSPPSPPLVLRSILALGFGLIFSTGSFILSPDFWQAAPAAGLVGSIVGAIIVKRDAIRHPESYPI